MTLYRSDRNSSISDKKIALSTLKRISNMKKCTINSTYIAMRYLQIQIKELKINNSFKNEIVNNLLKEIHRLEMVSRKVWHKQQISQGWKYV